jgi:hypothetical protein
MLLARKIFVARFAVHMYLILVAAFSVDMLRNLTRNTACVMGMLHLAAMHAARTTVSMLGNTAVGADDRVVVCRAAVIIPGSVYINIMIISISGCSLESGNLTI